MLRGTALNSGALLPRTYTEEKEMSKYKRRYGDRKEGRLLRSLPAFAKFIPFIMPTRNDACNQYE